MNRVLILTAMVSAIIMVLAPTGAMADGVTVIGERWGGEHIAMVTFDLDNGFDWDNETEDLLDEEWAIDNPVAAEGQGGEIWLAWDNDGVIYVAMSKRGNEHWSIQSRISDDNEVLSEPHLFIDGNGRIWLSYVSLFEAMVHEPYFENETLATELSTPWIDQSRSILVRSSQDGIHWTPPVVVSSEETYTNDNPWFTTDNGMYWLVWDTSPMDGDSDIMISNSPDGIDWSYPVPIIHHDTDDDSDPCMIFKDGLYYLVWVSDSFDTYSYFDHGNEDNIVFSVSADGYSWSTPSAIHPRFSDEYAPYLSTDNTGSLVLTWTSDREYYDEMADERDTDTEIWYSIYKEGKWSVPTALTTSPYYDDDSSVFHDDDAFYWMFWEREGSIYYSKSMAYPLITEFEGNIHVDTYYWEGTYDNTYMGPVAKTFTLSNVGDRDIEGTVNISRGFSADWVEFRLSPGETIDLTVELVIMKEGHHLGWAMIRTNDADEPVITLDLDITFTDHSNEDDSYTIPSKPTKPGGGGGGGEEEEDQAVCSSVTTGLVIILLLLLLLVFLSTRKGGGGGGGHGGRGESKPLRPLDDEDEEDEDEEDEKEDEKEEEEEEDEDEDDDDDDDDDDKKSSSRRKRSTIGAMTVLGVAFCLGLMLLSSILGPATSVWAQDLGTLEKDDPRIIDQTPETIMIWYPYYNVEVPPDVQLREERYTLSSTLKSGGDGPMSGSKQFYSSSAVRQLVKVPYPVEKFRFWMAHDTSNDPDQDAKRFMVHLYEETTSANDYIWGECVNKTASWCEVDVSNSDITNVPNGGTYNVEVTPPFDMESTGSSATPMSNVLFLVSPNMTQTAGTEILMTDTLSDGKFTYVFTDAAEGYYFKKFQSYGGGRRGNIILDEETLYRTPRYWNMKMDLYIRAGLFSGGGVDEPAYPAYRDNEMTGAFSFYNPFQDENKFTIRLGLLTPNGTEYNMMDKEIDIGFQKYYNLNFSYDILKNTNPPLGEYHIVAGVYFSKNGKEVMLDKWGDTSDEFRATQFSLVNYTPIQSVEVVDEIANGIEPGKIPVYHIWCEDAPGKASSAVRDNFLQAFDDLESSMSVSFQHIFITDTRQFNELVQSDASDGIIINYHLDTLPIPEAFIRKGDFIFQDSVALYRFDDENGTAVKDGSLYQNEGTLLGGGGWTKYSNSGPSAVTLDGVDDLVKFRNRDYLNLSTMTVDLYVNLSQDYTSGTKYILSLGTGNDGFAIYLDQTSGTDPNQIKARLGNGITTQVVTGGSISSKTWHRVTMLYDNEEGLSLYIDNKMQGTADAIGNMSYNATAPMLLGGVTGVNESFAAMSADDLRITKDIRIPGVPIEGDPQDAMNWVKRVGAWIAEKEMVFVNLAWVPFTAVGNTEVGWNNNRIVISDEGFASLLEARSLPGAINHFQTGGTQTSGTVNDLYMTEEAEMIEDEVKGDFLPVNDLDPQYRPLVKATLTEEFDQYSIPFYRVTDPGNTNFLKDEIVAAIIPYGEGAILFHGADIDFIDQQTVAPIAFWYLSENIRPAYIVDATDAPHSSTALADSATSDVKSALATLGGEAGVRYYPITIGSTVEFERLVGSNVRDTIVVNTHGEVLPVPKSYVNGVSVTDDTILLYNFEDVNADVLHDESGNHNNAKIVGATIVDNSYFGHKGLSLSGSNSYVSVTKNPNMIPNKSNTPFTIEFSMYLNTDYSDPDKVASIVSAEYTKTDKDGTHTYGYAVKVSHRNDKDNVLFFSIGSTTKDWITLYSDTPIESKKWYRVAAVFDGAGMRLFIDYVKVGDMAVPSPFHVQAVTNTNIGQSSIYSNEFLNAVIDNLRLSKGAKTKTQLQLDTISHKEWLTAVNDWIATNGIMFVDLEGYDMRYLGLVGEPWGDHRTFIGSDGLNEFLAPTLPDLNLVNTTEACQLSDVGSEMDTALPSSGLKGASPMTGKVNIPNSYDMFTVPIYEGAASMSHGLVYVGKGFLMHTGPAYASGKAKISLAPVVWQDAVGDVQMIYLIDVPPSKAYIESINENSPHPYSTFGWWTNTVERTGQQAMRVHFDRIMIHDDHDAVHIYDKNDVLIQSFTKSCFDVWSEWVQGDKIKIVMASTDTKNWGYHADKLMYMTKLSDAGAYTAVAKDEIIEKFEKLEARTDKQDIYIDIDSGSDFAKLLSGHVENPIVLNLHGTSFPLPNDGTATAQVKTDDKVPSGFKAGGLLTEFYQDDHYDNPSGAQFKKLVVTKVTPNIYYDWGYGKPDPAIAADYFSIKWHGMIKVDKDDTYTFQLVTDDGSILYIDDEIVIDAWKLQCPKAYTGSHYMTAGYHKIEYRYYERYGNTRVTLEMKGSGDKYFSKIPSDHLFYTGGVGAPPEGFVSGGLWGTYYDDHEWTKSRFGRKDETIDFTWGGVPGPSIAGDFGVVWSGALKVDKKDSYTFHFEGSISGTVKVGNMFSEKLDTVITTSGGSAGTSKPIALDEGYYSIVVDYYGTSGAASAKLSWSTSSMSKTVVPGKNLMYYDGDKVTQTWIEAFGRWVSENGATFANAKDYPFQEAIIEGYGTFSLGSEGFNDFLSPRIMPISIVEDANATGYGSITSVGKAIARDLPSGVLTDTIQDITTPLPASVDCIPIYIDEGSDQITHAIVPYGRGAYVHSGGFSVDALVTMTFMYASDREALENYADLYYKGDTVTYKVVLENKNPTSIDYLIYLSLFTGKGGDEGQDMVDAQTFTMQTGDNLTIYLTWTPVQTDDPGGYTMSIVVLDVEDSILVQQYGNGANNDTLQAKVRVAAFISKIVTDEVVGYFEPVKFTVYVTNEMYIDEDFSISGMFTCDKTNMVYWNEETVDFTVPGLLTRPVEMTWDRAEQNYENQSFDLGLYIGSIYLDDGATAHGGGTKVSLDMGSASFEIVGELQIKFPTGLGMWELSYNGGDGPFEPIDPSYQGTLGILRPEKYNIWIRRVGFNYSVTAAELNDVSNSTAFRISYKADTGKVLYLSANLGLWNENKQAVDYYRQKVLKLPGNGDTLDPTQTYASYWQAGTTLMISEIPLMRFDAADYRTISKGTPDNTGAGVNIQATSNAFVTYDLTLNEANFYKFFITATNNVKGDVVGGAYIFYWDGVDWQYADETPKTKPIPLTWNKKDNSNVELNFQVKLNASTNWYTLRVQWNKGQQLDVQTIGIMPAPSLDSEPRNWPDVTMGNKEGGSRSGSGDDVGPFGEDNLNATFRTVILPEFMLTALYEMCPIPLIGTEFPFQGPAVHIYGGKYVAVDLNWFVALDEFGFKRAWVALTIGGEITMEGSGIIFSYQVLARVDWDRDNEGSTEFEKMNWTVEMTVNLDIPIGRMIWGFPIDYRLEYHKKTFFHLLFDIYLGFSLQLTITGKFKDPPDEVWTVKFYTRLYAKFVLDFILDISTVYKGLNRDEANFQNDARNIENELQRAKADYDDMTAAKKKWMEDNHDKYGTYKNALEKFGHTDDSKELYFKVKRAEDRYNDLNQRYIAAEKKRHETNDNKQKLGPFKWIKAPSFAVNIYFVSGVALGFSIEIPHDRSYIHMLVYMEVIVKFSFYIKFTFRFLFWKFMLIIIGIWFTWDKIVWYNKIAEKGDSTNFDNDGFWGKFPVKDREWLRYNDPGAYKLLFKWADTSEYSSWGLEILKFRKV